MHILFNNKGVLDDKKAPRQEWHDLLRQIRENGHTVGVIASDDFGDIMQQTIGIKASEFDNVYPHAEKTSVSAYEDIAEERGICLEELGLVDNDYMSVMITNKIGMIGIYYQSFDVMKHELKTEKIIPL